MKIQYIKQGAVTFYEILNLFKRQIHKKYEVKNSLALVSSRESKPSKLALCLILLVSLTKQLIEIEIPLFSDDSQGALRVSSYGAPTGRICPRSDLSVFTLLSNFCRGDWLLLGQQSAGIFILTLPPIQLRCFPYPVSQILEDCI